MELRSNSKWGQVSIRAWKKVPKSKQRTKMMNFGVAKKWGTYCKITWHLSSQNKITLRKNRNRNARITTYSRRILCRERSRTTFRAKKKKRKSKRSWLFTKAQTKYNKAAKLLRRTKHRESWNGIITIGHKCLIESRRSLKSGIRAYLTLSYTKEPRHAVI